MISAGDDYRSTKEPTSKNYDNLYGHPRLPDPLSCWSVIIFTEEPRLSLGVARELMIFDKIRIEC